MSKEKHFDSSKIKDDFIMLRNLYWALFRYWGYIGQQIFIRFKRK